MHKYMEIAIKEARKAYKKGEVPVGAVIVCDNKILAKAHNNRKKSNLTIGHAEILAINIANRKKKTWILDDCELYVTLEPCMMCAGAIVESRIKKIYCNLTKTNDCSMKWLKENNVQVIKDETSSENTLLLQSFFQKKR